jgi:hypothetical protein
LLLTSTEHDRRKNIASQDLQKRSQLHLNTPSTIQPKPQSTCWPVLTMRAEFPIQQWSRQPLFASNLYSVTCFMVRTVFLGWWHLRMKHCAPTFAHAHLRVQHLRNFLSACVKAYAQKWIRICACANVTCANAHVQMYMRKRAYVKCANVHAQTCMRKMRKWGAQVLPICSSSELPDIFSLTTLFP